MYRALYRKWRPKSFADVVGQADITTALMNQISHNKVGHAYIFTGTRGTGKTTCAKLFAKAVNCQHPNGADPCGECAICTGIDSGSIMDVVEIDAASNNGVDNIRDLRDETAYTPSTCTYKVYIIDEVHMLTNAAFNALLKIMEEPPSHIIFILATTEIHKVPATILSRCQRYDFTRISPKDIEDRLLYVAGQEAISLTQEAAGLIARLADGAMRDALSILDTCAGITDCVDESIVRRMAGVTDKSYLFELSDAIAAQDAVSALCLVAQLREKSIDIKRLCDELILHYRNLLLAGVPNGRALLVGVSPGEEQRFVESAPKYRQKDVVRAIKILCSALDKMGKSTDPQIELEVALFKMCESEPEIAPSAYSAPQAAVPISPAAPLPFTSAPIMQPAAPAIQPVQESSPAVQPDADSPVKIQPELANVTQSPENAQGSAKRDSSQLPTLPEGISIQPFEQWNQVVAAMEKKDKLLYVNLNNSKAYYDGRRILIDGSDLFLEYMRQNEYSSQLIKETIEEVTGVHYGIGPYKKKKKTDEAVQNADAVLEQLAQQGVSVIFEDE